MVIELDPYLERDLTPFVVRGRVVYKDDQSPVGRVRVGCASFDQRNEMNLCSSAITDADGTFHMEQLDTVDSVEVGPIDASYRKTFPVRIGREEAKNPITLEIDRVTAVLSGVIRGAGEKLHMYVQLKGKDFYDSQRAGGEPERIYSFHVPAGSYQMSVYGDGIVVERSISLQKGEQRILDVEIVKGSAAIHGQVRASDGTPPPRPVAMTLALLSGEATLTFRGTIDKHGFYEFKGLPPGTYVMDWGIQSASFFSLGQKRISFEEGGTLEENLNLPPLELLDLDVTDAMGKEDLFSECALEVRTKGSQIFSKPVGRDKERCASWGWPLLLPSGTYEIHLSCEGFQDVTREIVIPDRGRITEKVRLQKR